MVEADTGKIDKVFPSKARAKAYISAKNIGIMRSQGKHVPRARH